MSEPIHKFLYFSDVPFGQDFSWTTAYVFKFLFGADVT